MYLVSSKRLILYIFHDFLRSVKMLQFISKTITITRQISFSIGIIIKISRKLFKISSIHDIQSIIFSYHMLHQSETLGVDTESYLYRTKKSFLILFLVRNLPICMEKIFVFSVFLFVNSQRIYMNVPMISIGKKEIRLSVIQIKREKLHSLTSTVLIIHEKEFL